MPEDGRAPTVEQVRGLIRHLAILVGNTGPNLPPGLDAALREGKDWAFVHNAQVYASTVFARSLVTAPPCHGTAAVRTFGWPADVNMLGAVLRIDETTKELLSAWVIEQDAPGEVVGILPAPLEPSASQHEALAWGLWILRKGLEAIGEDGPFEPIRWFPPALRSGPLRQAAATARVRKRGSGRHVTYSVEDSRREWPERMRGWPPSR